MDDNWIPIKESFPEEDVNVLIQTKDNRLFIAHYSQWLPWNGLKCFILNDDYFAWIDAKDVVAWCKLPELYEENKDECILSALTCIAEGKNVTKPITSLNEEKYTKLKEAVEKIKAEIKDLDLGFADEEYRTGITYGIMKINQIIDKHTEGLL